MPVDPGTFLLELDTTTDRLADAVWVNVTDHFSGFADNRRRTGRRFWDPYQTASGTITVRDPTDTFDPETVDRAKIRLSVTYSGTVRRLFTGTIWNVETVGTLGIGTTIRRLTCYDAYSDFNEATIPTGTTIDGGRMDVFAGNALDEWGFPAARRAFDEARTTTGDYMTTRPTSVSQLLRLAEQAEAGVLSVTRGGTVRFSNRTRLNSLAQEDPEAYFGSDRLPAENIQIDRGSRNQLNQQTVEPAVSGQFVGVTVPDPSTLSEAQRRVGIKPGPVIRNALIDTQPEASSLAAFRVRLGVTPPIRTTFTTKPEAVDPMTGDHGFAFLYPLDIGSVIQCNFPRQGFAGNCYIENMALSFNRQANVWRCRIRAVQTPADDTWTLADANDPMDTRSVLGTNTALGF